MNLVLGLGMTSRAVRWVLVEGTTGEGNPVDRGAIAVDDVATYDPDGLLRGLADDTEASGQNRLHAIGVTWTSDAAPLASHVLQALELRGYGNVVCVSEVEAGGILATGIAEIAELEHAAVCIIEPDAAVLATVTPDALSTERIERSPLDTTGHALTTDIMANLAPTAGRAEAVFVLGSDASEPIVSALADASYAPVITAAEADLAFARGAAMAAALAVNTHDGQATPDKAPRLTKVGALTSVLAAAVVTLVVATSAAVGVQLHPGVFSQPREVAKVTESAPEADPPSVKKAVSPKPRPPAAPPAGDVPTPEAVPEAPAREIPEAPAPEAPEAPAPVAEVATAPEPPAYVPPEPDVPAAPAPEPAYVPPPPAYVPPPVVPPPATYPQPRLRDRIIERIPIINRFHEPKPFG